MLDTASDNALIPSDPCLEYVTLTRVEVFTRSNCSARGLATDDSIQDFSGSILSDIVCDIVSCVAKAVEYLSNVLVISISRLACVRSRFRMWPFKDPSSVSPNKLKDLFFVKHEQVVSGVAAYGAITDKLIPKPRWCLAIWLWNSLKPSLFTATLSFLKNASAPVADPGFNLFATLSHSSTSFAHSSNRQFNDSSAWFGMIAFGGSQITSGGVNVAGRGSGSWDISCWVCERLSWNDSTSRKKVFTILGDDLTSLTKPRSLMMPSMV